MKNVGTGLEANERDTSRLGANETTLDQPTSSPMNNDKTRVMPSMMSQFISKESLNQWGDTGTKSAHAKSPTQRKRNKGNKT